MKTPQKTKTEQKTSYAAALVPHNARNFASLQGQRKCIRKNQGYGVLVAAAFTLGAATARDAAAVGTDYLTDPTLMVKVGDAGNAADGTGYGAVSYEYQIGKYEVTNAQYAAFLNAVDSTGANTLALYNSNMNSNAYGGITWSGTAYVVKTGYELKPVNYVSFYDAMRFTNWLTTGGTETGVYNLLGGTAEPSNGTTVTRTLDEIPGTLWAVASEDEWYKAAYYNDVGTYRQYPVTGTPVSGTNENGGTANYWDNDSYAFSNGSLGNGDRIADVNHYDLVSGADSFYGTYQQGGNVWEWNDTIMNGTARGLRGGAFLSSGDNLASLARPNFDPANEDLKLGFRIVSLSSLAAVPEPGTYAAAMGLLILVIAMWARRSRRTRA
ncbi:MAG: formylglycine-generating enzyme family protein [Opitutaceae bacterium]|jgi:formylglycine-generating enzyme required for sulfatase activity|nr:formylglycine-generating enzyme family protein [Opitutaceae bacterium]